MKDIEKYLKELADQVVVEDSKSRIERLLKRIETAKANIKEREKQKFTKNSF